MADMTRRVVVVGSANRDSFTTVGRLPRPGETVLGDELTLRLGGKGMNQVVSAALMGARASFVGAVGDDDAGRAVVGELRERGVDTTGVRVLPDVSTGAAFVCVDSHGENLIIVVPGANSRVGAEQVLSASGDAGPGTVFVTQLEVPPAAVEAVAEAATTSGGRFVVNAAPYRVLPDHLLAMADPLVVNEHEAAALAGEPVEGGDDAKRVGALLARRCRSVVITLGPGGAVAASGGAVDLCRAPRVDVVDTTGAGDAFVGSLAATLAAGTGLATAVAGAVETASRSVARRGAQSSPPARTDPSMRRETR